MSDAEIICGCGDVFKPRSEEAIAIALYGKCPGCEAEKNGFDVGWISVTEGLPESSELVLVYCQEYSQYGIDFVKDGDQKEWGDLGLAVSDAYITHWRRLPSVPGRTKESE